MFHVKLVNFFRNLQIHEVFFLLFLVLLPFQSKLILNPGSAGIQGLFNYHKAVMVFASDLCFFAMFTAWAWKQNFSDYWPKLAIFLLFIPYLFHVEHWDLLFFWVIKTGQVVFLSYYVAKRQHLFIPIILTIAISAFFQAGIGIYQFHAQSGAGFGLLGEYLPDPYEVGGATLDTQQGKLIRAYGTFPHPNVFGGFLAISLAFWLYVSRETFWDRTNLIVSCGTMLILWGLIISFSRSAWIAAAAALGIHLVAIFIKNRKMAYLWAFFLIVSCGTLVFVYQDTVFPRTLEVSTTSDAAQYRATFNRLGIEIFLNNPILGTGPGQLIPKMEQYHLEPWEYQPPHNVLLVFLSTFGILGLVILAYLLKGFTWNTVEKGLIFTIISILIVLGMFDHYLLTIQQGILIMAVCIGLIMIKKDVSQVRETSQ
jgi:hypothetical protein